MIRQMLQLVWNRKRLNVLLVAEVFLTFLVVFFILSLSLERWHHYSQPMGFDYADVWHAKIDPRTGTDDTHTPEQRETARQILLAVGNLPEVVDVAGTMAVPYMSETWNTNLEYEDRESDSGFSEVTDAFRDVFGLQIVRGRWFEASDDAAGRKPIVITRRLQRELFPDDVDPIGEVLLHGGRVIGVVSEFRKDGELSKPSNFVFYRKRMDPDSDHRPPGSLVIKTHPGTAEGAFEEALTRTLRGIAPGWQFAIETMRDKRSDYFQVRLAIFGVAAFIAGGLMVMVALGLIGVLWQNVTQRTEEIGLRRAVGGEVSRIFAQLLGEMLFITSLALVLGVAFVIQFELMEWISFVSAGVYALSLAASVGVIYLLVVLCSLYPSWMATRIQPAQALRAE